MSRCEVHGVHLGEACPTCVKQFNRQGVAILVVAALMGLLYFLTR